MNKAVHALVYVILAVAGVALYFELNRIVEICDNGNSKM